MLPFRHIKYLFLNRKPRYSNGRKSLLSKHTFKVIWTVNLALRSSLQRAAFFMSFQRPYSAKACSLPTASNRITHLDAVVEQSEGSSSSFQSCIKALDNHISNLLAIFPCSPSVIAQSPDLTLAQALIGVAIIRRFNRFAQRDSKSRDRCFRAAFEVAATVREAVREGAWKIINPMIWVSEGSTSNVALTHSTYQPLYALCAGILGTYRSSDGDLGGRSAQDWQEALQVMLALFSRFSDRRPLGELIRDTLCYTFI